jgi:DNA-binding XRE family transcriptional regulator
MANDRDPRSDLGAWLGEELRGARADAGYKSQDQLARELGFDRTVIVKAESGSRPPSEDVAAKIAEKFPGLANGLYVHLAGIARKSNGPIPGWFADWLTREREATSIRIWQPIIVPGLLQTAGYARALFVGERSNLGGQSRLTCGWCWTRRCSTGSSGRPRPPMISSFIWPTCRNGRTS